MSETHTPDRTFPETRWSLVAAARTDGDSSVAHRALEQLCRLYWRPIYSFARMHGHSPHDSEDLTQAFFGALLQRKAFAGVDPERGRLRSFLLSAFKNFAASVHKRSMAMKRGGGVSVLSLDLESAEGFVRDELTSPVTPERVYDKLWALAAIGQALSRLGQEFCQRGETGRREFELIRPHLELEDGEGSGIAALADALKASRVAARQKLFRARNRLGSLIRETIADTLLSPTEDTIEAEIESLKAALRGPAQGQA
jgi:RNA polymerase sigma-70 factor (ECF subfamily)